MSKESQEHQKSLRKIDNPDTHYFYSAIGYNSKNQQCCCSNGIFPFDSENAKELNKDPFAFILKQTKKVNDKTEYVHIIALNKL